VTGAHKVHISVLVPVVERADSLVELHHSVLPEVQKLGSFEFLYLISAGFEDAFAQALELYEKDPSHVRVLRFARRLGAADALATGFDRARGDIAITLPSYFDADPAGLGALCAVVESGADMAFAVRTGRSDGLVKPLQTRLFSRFSSWATGTHFNDVASATRALRREMVRDLPLYGDFHHFLPVLAHGAGFRVVEVPVARDPRSHAPRVYRLRVYLYRGLDILSMFFLSHAAPTATVRRGGNGLWSARGGDLARHSRAEIAGHPTRRPADLDSRHPVARARCAGLHDRLLGRVAALLPGPGRARLPHRRDLRGGDPSATRAYVRRRVSRRSAHHRSTQPGSHPTAGDPGVLSRAEANR